MTIISTDSARAHLRIDGDDTEPNLPIYIAAAETAVQKFINRNVYPDAPTLQAAQAGAENALTAARTAFTGVRDTLSGLDYHEQQTVYEAAHAAWVEARWEYVATMRGVVTDETLQAATLLIVAHLYANREDVITGLRAAAVVIPETSQWLLEPYRAYLGVYTHHRRASELREFMDGPYFIEGWD